MKPCFRTQEVVPTYDGIKKKKKKKNLEPY